MWKRNKSSKRGHTAKQSMNSNELKNFTDIYQDMYNKISLHPGSSIVLPQKNNYCTSSAFGTKRDPALFDKLHNEKLGKIHLKIKEDSILQILEEEKELTFHPKVRNPFNLKRRSVDEFIQDMVR